MQATVIFFCWFCPVKINHILIINTLPFTTNAQWEENQRTDLKKIRGNRVRQSELILYSQLQFSLAASKVLHTAIPLSFDWTASRLGAKNLRCHALAALDWVYVKRHNWTFPVCRFQLWWCLMCCSGNPGIITVLFAIYLTSAVLAENMLLMKLW